MIKIRYR